jgi:hypothetical protein
MRIIETAAASARVFGMHYMAEGVDPLSPRPARRRQQSLITALE